MIDCLSVFLYDRGRKGSDVVLCHLEAPVMELVDMRDLGSRAATRTGSSPLRRTSSEISLTAALPAPKGRKAPQDGEFLRPQLRPTPLGSQLIFFTGDEGRGTGDERRRTKDGRRRTEDAGVLLTIIAAV